MNLEIRTDDLIGMRSFRPDLPTGRMAINTLIRRAPNLFRAKVTGLLDMRALLSVAGGVHHELYRRTGGKIGGTLRGGPVLLLTTKGRRTGKGRTRPLSYLHDGDDLVVVASAAGAPKHPAWFLNLQANSRVRVQQGGVTRTMMARIADERERARLWERVVQRYPVAASYQRRTGRQIPIVILRPALSAVPQPQSGSRLLDPGNARHPSWALAAA